MASGHMTNNPWADINNTNMGYVLEQYDLYLQESESLDESFKEVFDTWGAPPVSENMDQVTAGESGLSSVEMIGKMKTLASVLSLADNIRKYGHLEADVDPIAEKETTGLLELEHYDLTKADLKQIPASFICKESTVQLTDGLAAIDYLKQLYTNTIGFELGYVEMDEKNWLEEQIESGFFNRKADVSAQKKLLESLFKAEGFEHFIGKKYVGQKRFSVEGLEALVPLLNKAVDLSAEAGISNMYIAMAHRGRLNVLTHVLEKPYEAMLSQFQHSKWENEDPTLEVIDGVTGDVKYHLGATKTRHVDGKQITVTLGNNPSHLEFSGSVTEGQTRAAQDDRSEACYPKQDKQAALPVLVHGDAAFTGQGIVTETLNFGNTTGYTTGGTIHVIANNNIGFTTETEDDRSTLYSSDIVKGFNIPVLHVNADDPEASLKAMELSFAYREKFQKDILIDLIGYRRLGHNEMDEPRSTNPTTYQTVDAHPTVTAVYSDKLLAEKVVNEEKVNEIKAKASQTLEDAYANINQEQEEVIPLEDRNGAYGKELSQAETSVDKAKLAQINNELLEWPEGFNVFRKLQKILNRRRDAVDNGKKVDWGHAEALAFGAILNNGTPIRLTGEDTERGTFSHRNLVLSDSQTGKKYSPLHGISTSNASFAIHNSTLSENGVVGFEYGYSVEATDTLVLWEAQFGDFANGAQVMFDQFLSSGREKWGQKSSLVLLLPHGYEGQGPEHSSARLERFLQLAAENNMSVTNLSTSGNYFHALRRQANSLGTEDIRPLVIMSPKSLLRNASASVYLEELTNGGFQPIIEEPALGKDAEQVERIVLSSGRLAVELSDNITDEKAYSWLDMIRVEELYPFPEEEIKQVFNKYKNLKEIVWTQEEPKNMGAWSYIAPLLEEIAPRGIQVSYNGRPKMASPSEGDPLVHKQEQQRIINNALTQTSDKDSFVTQ